MGTIIRSILILSLFNFLHFIINLFRECCEILGIKLLTIKHPANNDYCVASNMSIEI